MLRIGLLLFLLSVPGWAVLCNNWERLALGSSALRSHYAIRANTVELVSGGRGSGVGRPALFDRGFSGGVYPAVIRKGGVDYPCVEKTIDFSPNNRQEYALKMTELAGEKGLGPEFYGMRDRPGVKPQRSLYMAEVGRGALIVDSVPVFKRKFRDRFPGIAYDQELEVGKEISRRAQAIASYHPDGANSANILAALYENGDGTYRIEVKGIDWDFPPEFGNPEQQAIKDQEIIRKLAMLRSAPANLNPPIPFQYGGNKK